jgi:hypothetical protein
LLGSGAGLAGERAKGQKMPEINAATGALTIPIWAVGAVAAVFLVLLLLTIAQAGTTAVVHTLPRAMIVIAVACAGWIYIDNANQQEQAAARRALDERSAALLARVMTPGSALSCLNGVSGEAVEAACEKTVFASPETVSAAVSYVSAELDLLIESAVFAARFDHAYLSQLAQLQGILQRDRFGIVAHVLTTRGCTVEKCDAANLIGDPTHVLANLHEQVFEANVTKFATAWSHGAATAGAEAATGVAARAAAVSSQYDFPSATSIPPVNIMAPEPAPRSAPAASGAPAASSAPRQQAAAPVPARRPPQPRPPAAASRPPVAVGEAPTDGASTSSPQ